MKKWLTSFFLLLALAGGVLAGTPLHAGNMNSQPMKCCKKMKSNGQAPASSLVRLHCAINCTDSSPLPGGSSSSFSPAGIKISDSIIIQIARLLSIKEKTNSPPAISLERAVLSLKIPPKYIQHHSILI
jgi:hypothetical protein